MSNGFAALAPNYQQVPMNIPAETALLGALLANNRAIDRCPGLKATDFAGENLGEVYQAITDGMAAGHVVDAVSLSARFEPKLLTGLLASMVGILNAGDYARVIRDAARARALIEIGETLVEAARLGTDPGGIASIAAKQIDELTTGTSPQRQFTLDAAMDEAITAIERARSGISAGIRTGFRSFDNRLGGLEPGLVYVIAGRPAMGKSAVGHQIAINAARDGVGVLELSLEMSARQLGMRAISTASGVPLNRMKSGQIDDTDASRIVRARKELAELPLTIDDTGGQTPTQIAIKARSAKRKHGLGLVLIDHLNLMVAEDSDARHGGTWSTERASATVLQIAKDCSCPVVLLAQLNRGVEGREDKHPILSDLRQAGAIEQDAYAVGFVYRAEYYLGSGPEPKEGERTEKFNERVDYWEMHRNRVAGQADLIWAKVRDGQPGIDKMRFDAPTTTFSEVW